jgi:hypothetical protein
MRPVTNAAALKASPPRKGPSTSWTRASSRHIPLASGTEDCGDVRPATLTPETAVAMFKLVDISSFFVLLRVAESSKTGIMS